MTLAPQAGGPAPAKRATRPPAAPTSHATRPPAAPAWLADALATRLERTATNLAVDRRLCSAPRQGQTRDAFSRKWSLIDHDSADFERSLARQRRWYLELYGFGSEAELARFLRERPLVIDAGCGAGGKAAWLAELAPESWIVAVDISDSVHAAARRYAGHPNLFFVQADIARLDFVPDLAADYVSCDQVIHHTEDPEATFRELVRTLRPGGEVSVYVYRRKALPRELLDEHFRQLSESLDHEQVLALSRQLTELGRTLSQLEVEIDVPSIPLLGIEGGRTSLQRFLYWNFLKCFWNEELGWETSVRTNYDWYAPCQAQRYTEAELRGWIERAVLEERHFHALPSSYSGRFRRR